MKEKEHNRFRASQEAFLKESVLSEGCHMCEAETGNYITSRGAVLCEKCLALSAESFTEDIIDIAQSYEAFRGIRYSDISDAVDLIISAMKKG